MMLSVTEGFQYTDKLPNEFLFSALLLCEPQGDLKYDYYFSYSIRYYIYL